MRAPPSRPLAVLLLLAAACTEAPPGDETRPPLECGPGARSTESGGCEPVLPPATCGPRELTWGGEERCHRIEGFDCPAGTSAGASDWSCEPILAEHCPAGTRPSLGSTACVAVGWNDCPAGFAPHASGWGCAAIAAEQCSGSTRPELGREGCVDLGDCDAPFPPAGALVVDDSFTDAEVGPARFRTIQAALDAAAEGATIAIEEGSYVEALSIRRAVRLVGRCAARTELVAATADGSALDAEGDFALHVSGLAIRGSREALDLSGGVRATASGLLIEDAGNSAIRCFGAGSELHLERSVVRATRVTAQGLGGSGVWLSDGCRGTITDSTLADNEGPGAVVDSADGALTLGRSVVARNGSRRPGPGFAGLWLREGGSAEVHETLFLESRGAAIFATSSGGRVVVRRTEFRGSVLPPEGFSGAILSNGSELDVEDVRIEGQQGIAIAASTSQTSAVRNAVITGTLLSRSADPAVGAARGASLSMVDSVVFDNETLAVRSIEAALTARGLLLAANGSVRASGSALVDSGGSLELSDSFITGSRGIGLHAEHAGSTAALERVVVQQSRVVSDAFLSAGVSAAQGARVTLSRSLLRDNADAGIGLEDAELLLEDSLVQRTSTPRVGPHGNGVFAGGASKVRIARSQLAQNRVAGVRALPGSAVELEDVVVLGDALRRPEFEGLGIAVFGRLEARRLAVIGTDLTGVHLASRSATTFDQLRISGTRPSGGEHGHGLVVIEGTAALSRSQLDANGAVGALFSGSTADVRACALSRNGTGAHAQLGSAFVTAPGEAAPGEVRIGPDTFFLENSARLGSDVVPLPAVQAD